VIGDEFDNQRKYALKANITHEKSTKQKLTLFKHSSGFLSRIPSNREISDAGRSFNRLVTAEKKKSNDSFHFTR
jgi:hypothetical protein